MADVVVAVENLAVEIAGHEVLTDVSFTAPRGACIGIAGESGSGKSVTCRALTGQLGRIGGRIVRGGITFEGHDLTTVSQREWQSLRGRRVGFVPQASMWSLDPVMRIGAQLKEAVRVLDPPSDPSQRALELLELVELREPHTVLRQYPHQLSGGMRQRVMISLALVGRPTLLVADEPTTALDVTVQRGILELLDRLRRDGGLTVVLVTHDLAIVRAFTDQVAIMYAGAIVEHGPVDLILEQPRHPYTAALLAADPSAAVGSRLSAIPGSPATAEDRPSGCPFWPRCRFAGEPCANALPPVVRLEDGRDVACIRSHELTVALR